MVHADAPVVTYVSDRDAMYHGNDEHYFGVGRSALACVDGALSLAGVGPERIGRVLDLACGHGRVMRNLRHRFPQASIVGMDIDRDGVEFCARTFGSEPVVADPDVRRLRLDGPFDLIWCGSLLTHLERDRFEHVLRAAADALNGSGVAVLTTHGRLVTARIERGLDDYGLGAGVARDLADEARVAGFAYRDYATTDGYGISISQPAWLVGRVGELLPHHRIVALTEAGWDGHQDVVAFAPSTWDCAR